MTAECSCPRTSRHVIELWEDERVDRPNPISAPDPVPIFLTGRIAARDMPVDARHIRCQPARSWSLPSRSVRAAASSSLGRAPPVFIARYGAQPVATFHLLTTILMEPAASANPVRRVHHAVAQRSPCQTTTRRAAAGSKTGHHYRRRSCSRGTWVSIRPG